MIRPSRIAILLALAIASAHCSSHAAVIDDFSTGPFSIEVLRFETESINLTGLPATSVLGRSRFVTLNGLGPTATSSVRVGVDTVPSEFFYDADPGATAANFRVVYGNSTSLAADLTADGANAIVFDFAFADFEREDGYFDITVTTQPSGSGLLLKI